MATTTISRRGIGDAGEYHAHVDGSTQVGVLSWVRQGNARVIEHTLVPPAIGGRGVAAALVEALIADAREQGFLIVPACSYVAASFKRHPEWGDLLANP